VGYDGTTVVFRYRDRADANRSKLATLDAQTFCRRFLHHVLPKGFPKVRHYGLASSAHSQDRACARRLLPEAVPSARSDPPATPSLSTAPSEDPAPLCPICHHGHLHVIRTLRARRNFPP